MEGHCKIRNGERAMGKSLNSALHVQKWTRVDFSCNEKTPTNVGMVQIACNFQRIKGHGQYCKTSFSSRISRFSDGMKSLYQRKKGTNKGSLCSYKYSWDNCGFLYLKRRKELGNFRLHLQTEILCSPQHKRAFKYNKKVLYVRKLKRGEFFQTEELIIMVQH